MRFYPYSVIQNINCDILMPTQEMEIIEKISSVVNKGGQPLSGFKKSCKSGFT